MRTLGLPKQFVSQLHLACLFMNIENLVYFQIPARPGENKKVAFLFILIFRINSSYSPKKCRNKLFYKFSKNVFKSAEMRRKSTSKIHCRFTVRVLICRQCTKLLRRGAALLPVEQMCDSRFISLL
jgi:hypothetical protein